MVASSGSFLPFSIKFPEDSTTYFTKTIKRMKSIIECVLQYHMMGLALTNIQLDTLGHKNYMFGDSIPLVVNDLSGIMLINKKDRLKNGNGSSAPEVHKAIK